jgi:hypothetical protein
MGTTSVVRVPGDYQIVVSNGGVVIDVNTSATLHTANAGAVTIYGNLDVIGNTTYLETTDTRVTDNILVLNSGETNEYVTKGTAGIAIARGNSDSTSSAATFLYNDGVYWNYENASTNRGIWELSVGSTATGVAPSALRVNAIRIGSNQNFLNFLGKENPSAVLNVRGTTDYEQNVLLDDDIPNKKYVDDRFFIGNELARKLRVGFTQIEINDNNVAPSDPYYSTANRIVASLGTYTNVVFKLEGQQALIQGLTINGSEIVVNGGGQSNNLILNPANTGTVQIESALSILNSPRPIGTLQGHVDVYTTATIGGGGTGINFVNNNIQDELVSRKRAIIYGIIF